MGITTEEFFENIYSVLFAPKDFFENQNIKISIRLALAVIVLLSAFKYLIYSITNNSIFNFLFVLTLTGKIITSVVMWLLVALGCEYCAKIFDKSGKFSKILYLTAFAAIPTIFFAPLSLLKNAGELGYILAVILGMLLYLWTFILYAYAIKAAYNISLARAFMFIFLPVIAFMLLIYQFVDFYYKIMYIFSI